MINKWPADTEQIRATVERLAVLLVGEIVERHDLATKYDDNDDWTIAKVVGENNERCTRW